MDRWSLRVASFFENLIQSFQCTWEFRMARFLISVFFSVVAVASVHADIITISELNADTNDQLEGTLAGPGVNVGSAVSITSVPTLAQVASTTASYLVQGVDLDGDGLFSEDFEFSITLSSDDDILFSTSREVFGTGSNATIFLNDSFSVAVDVVSDTSTTHDVSFDGVFEIDFQSLVDANFAVTDSSGTDTFIADADNTVLPRLYVDPLFQYITGGNDGRFGTVEEWSIQFSSAAAVPEPNSFVMLGIAFLSLTSVRRRLE